MAHCVGEVGGESVDEVVGAGAVFGGVWFCGEEGSGGCQVCGEDVKVFEDGCALVGSPLVGLGLRLLTNAWMSLFSLRIPTH